MIKIKKKPVPNIFNRKINKYNYFKRIIDEIRLGLIQIKLVKLHEPSIVQSANNPLLSQLILLFFCK